MDRLIRNLGENINDRFEADPEGKVQDNSLESEHLRTVVRPSIWLDCRYAGLSCCDSCIE